MAQIRKEIPVLTGGTHRRYHPITATPFACSDTYMEFAPCEALRPYIRCFWGTKQPVRKETSETGTTGIVTPDTCMDIIFKVDFTNHRIGNTFCGINDRTFSTTDSNDAEKTIFTFAIRFYAWSVPVFSEESMRGTRNAYFDAGYHFPKIKKEIEALLFDVTDVYELIPKVEAILLNHARDRHRNQTVLEAVGRILERRGTLSIGGLAKEMHVSDRQLERLFREYVGVSPKNLASLVRYQCLWQDIAYSRQVDILDAVYAYGYSDQAHLYHDFKKYHTMNPMDAKKYAMQNVGNIQETQEQF